MLPYRPALRFKQGEYTAVGGIRADLQEFVRPYFILPPLVEKDPELGQVLTHDQIATVTGQRIAKHWPRYPAYLDAQYMLAEPSDEGIVRLYRVARAQNDKLIAVAPASDLANPIWSKLALPTFPRLAIHLRAENLDAEQLAEGIKSLGIDAADCEIFVDFSDLELGMEDVGAIVNGTLDDLSEIAQWGCIVFQGSNFPTKNPAEAGKTAIVPRHEWTIFNEALRDCDIPHDRLGFSDFGADCGKINFPKKKSSAIAIPHIRYTTKTSTLVIRGAATGNQSERMVAVLKELTGHADFAGKSFSYADKRMWDTANGRATAGTASNWREWNMAHHILRVVTDLAAMTGVSLEEDEVLEEIEQVEMF
jgi:hypothetical protein